MLFLLPSVLRGPSGLLWGDKSWCLSTLLGGDKPPFVATNACFALASQTALRFRAVPSASSGGAAFFCFFCLNKPRLSLSL